MTVAAIREQGELRIFEPGPVVNVESYVAGYLESIRDNSLHALLKAKFVYFIAEHPEHLDDAQDMENAFYEELQKENPLR